ATPFPIPRNPSERVLGLVRHSHPYGTFIAPPLHNVYLSHTCSHTNKWETCLPLFMATTPPTLPASFRPSYPSTGCFNRPEQRRLNQRSHNMAFTQRGHPPILPTVITYIHSLSGVSFCFRIPMLMCWRP
ncbi:hypothetical protein HOY80DRAFT_993581, partial [Tuber brumale]